MSTSEKGRILIVDDDEQLSEILGLVLESEGYTVAMATTSESALQILKDGSPFSLMLLDLKLGEFSGLELLPQVRELGHAMPIFMITAHGDVESAVEAFNLGATGYIRKPFQEGALKIQIAEAIEKHSMNLEVRQPQIVGANDVRALIRSRDQVMEPLLRRIASAAQVSSNVVVTGESGTGKELVARALHQFGPRRNAPFIALNCAALPETLLEAELFGVVRGAFTDAKETKPGLFVRAERGTLFLDEIGDAPLSIQAKLLRVLQEREVLPLGGTKPVKIDVRVISATHRSLQDEVLKGTFRQDLFYRLHVIPVHIPALRERPKDILFLATLFSVQIAERLKLSFGGFSHSAEQALLGHSWTGNVRELQNRIEHAIACGGTAEGGGLMTASELFPEESYRATSLAPELELPSTAEAFVAENLLTFIEAKNLFERSYLEKILMAAKGNITKAAKLASKSRTEVYSMLRKHGLNQGAFKSDRGGDDS